MRIRLAVLSMAAAAASAAAASATPAPSASPTPIVVEIKNFAFVPALPSVPLGASVTFVNRDGAAHTATAVDKSWDTGNLDQGQSKTLTFAKAGVFAFVCLYHPNMVGSLAVGMPSPARSATPTPAATFNSGY